MQLDTDSARTPVRWGILSTSNIAARAVAPAIVASSNGELAAVGTSQTEKARELYSFVPDIRIYDSYEGVLRDPEIEAVYIPVPNGLHAEWSIKALEAGKHVLCEKPLAVIAREGVKMADAARANHRLLMEAFMYRFHPQTEWILERIRAGEVGTVKLVRVSFSFDIRSNPDNIRLKPELAGGALMDIGCYGVNMCRAVFGHPPRSVAARAYVPSPAGVDFSTNAVLDFGDGRFGLIDCSLEAPMRQGVEIVGEEGVVTVPVPFTPGNIEAVVFATKEGRINERKFPRVDQYQLQVEHFADCIRGQGEPRLSISESLENMATIEAIFEAAGMDWPII